MECENMENVSEEWVLEKCQLKHGDICVVEELSLSGNIRQKISTLGNSLVSFISLRILDISRNNISSLEGLQYCQALEQLNVYYNNVSSMSELMKLARNSKLQQIDLRLNPISVMSTEYRLLLVHALPHLTLLDNVRVTEKDRMLSLNYHSTDQAAHLAEYKGEGVAAGDLRLDGNNETASRSSSRSTSSSIPADKCEKYISDLRPPLSVLQPTCDAYDAFAAHGSFTPNPKTRNKEVTPVSSPLRERYKEELPLREQNQLLKEKYKDIKQKYNAALADRISKESYIKLQEDYYKSLKKNEEMEAVYSSCNEELVALKQHIDSLSAENATMKQELAIKEQVCEVDKEIKVVCRELQETLANEREKHATQMAQFTANYEELAKTFSQTLANMEAKYEERAKESAERHLAEIQKSHENFTNLQNLVDLTQLVGKGS